MKKDFQIFSWRQPFLGELKKFVVDISGGKPGNTLIITPNRRPARYMTDLFRKDKKAVVLPKMMTIMDMVTIWRSALSHAPLRTANTLDQVGLLHECVMEIAQSDDFLAEHFARMQTMADFLPWGLRLAGVLEDFAMEGTELADMANLAPEIGNPAAALLGCLKRIGDTWQKKLAERNWTTPGFDHYQAAQHPDLIPRLLLPSCKRPVIIAGFYILSGTHNRLLRALWEKGAYICLHTDPAIAENRQPHHACIEHKKWLEAWKAKPVLASGGKRDDPVYSFFSGHDLHSQLAEMANILESPAGERMSTAVIPGRNDTLMATLQNMPEANVNISMGYPMDRTPFARLLTDILAMVKNSPAENIWQSADVLKVIRHPYLNMLKFADNAGSGPYLSTSLQRLDYKIRKCGMYWDSVRETDMSVAAQAFRFISGMFASVSTPGEMARAVEELCAWLAEHGAGTWTERFPLDVEVMYRLVHDIIPVLRNNMLADCVFDFPVLGEMLMQLVRAERIPFEADPMQGLQVLGMLESRLLQFDRIVILDATDDVLPGNPAQDPLLPDSLRFLLGLPDSRRAEAAAAHNLYRLCMGAKEVHFLWQEGVAKSDFYDSKKVRSRFVEKLIWEKEQQNPDLLKKRHSCVRSPVCSLSISQPSPGTIMRTPQLAASIENFWKKPVSVTSIDSYLRCPLEFIWSHVAGLGANDKSGDVAPVLVGNLVHKILEDLYRPVGRIIDKNQISDKQFQGKLEDSFERIATAMGLRNRVPLDAYLTLKNTIPARLGEFWQNQPENTFLVDLEVKLDNVVEINGQAVNLLGRADRLDLRDGSLYIMDYKTGRLIPENDPGFWRNEKFFQRVEQACASCDMAELDECYALLRNASASLQLAAYMLLLGKSSYVEHGQPGNAAWVPLRYMGVEQHLFDTPLETENDVRLEHCRKSLELIHSHMHNQQLFVPGEDANCEICGYKNLCWKSN